MIEKKTVEYVADLARLGLTDGEKILFTKELGAIITYIDQLNQADTDHVEPTAYIETAHNALRDDIPQECLSAEKALENGPVVKKGFFAVPKVINNP